jgi:hypothetical protein
MFTDVVEKKYVHWKIHQLKTWKGKPTFSLENNNKLPPSNTVLMDQLFSCFFLIILGYYTIHFNFDNQKIFCFTYEVWTQIPQNKDMATWPYNFNKIYS